mgnify:CR=1 FL=1
MEKDILGRLYQTTREREPNKEYKDLAKKYTQEKEDFMKKIGENNRADLDQLTDTIYAMDNILGFEDFCNRILNGSNFVFRMYI